MTSGDPTVGWLGDLCGVCGHRIEWLTTRSAWRHVTPGADHAPLPARRGPDELDEDEVLAVDARRRARR